MNPNNLPFDSFVLPDGQTVGTGLRIPLSTASKFQEYEVAGPMVSLDDIIAAAKSKQFLGRTKFDKSWVKNQRSHGSCQGFATSSALSKARHRRGLDRVDLSGAYAYSKVNGGNDNGSMLEDGMESAERDGICEEVLAGWDAIYPNRYDRIKCDENAKQYKAFECYVVRTEIALASALINNFDCVTAVHADNGFMKLDSDGIAGGGNGPGNHAVHCDGIDWNDRLKKLIFDHQNSWDVTYGQNGRMFTYWDRHHAPTTRYHQFYAIRSTIDGPKDDFPVANV